MRDKAAQVITDAAWVTVSCTVEVTEK
jgi:hypothetical protein